MDKVELGKRLREARVQKGYTQEQLSEIAEIGIMYLGEIERGVKMPSMKIFCKIVEALDISADYVLRYEITSGKNFVDNELSKKLEGLTPKQKKTINDLVDAYIANL